VPELSRFLGIVIYMYYRERAPPHFHAEFAEFESPWKLRPVWLPGSSPVAR